MIEFYVDFKISSKRQVEHWTATHKRNKKNHLRLIAAWSQTKPIIVKPPCTIGITRLFNASKHEKLMDYDNYVNACKGIRDRISAIIIPGLAPGRADAEKNGLTFKYAQEKSDNSTFKIKIEYAK